MSESRARGLKSRPSDKTLQDQRTALVEEVVDHYLGKKWIRPEDVSEFREAISISCLKEELEELKTRE